MDSYSLPQELTDRILDFFHNDRKSLLNCRMVCKCWLPCASYHLFHRLTIFDSLDLSRTAVVPYVRSLRIISTGFRRINELQLQGLSRLTGLRELHLESFPWDRLSSNVRRDLYDLLPRLVALELRRIAFPSLEVLHAFILSASSLRRLYIKAAVYSSSDRPPDSLLSGNFVAPLQQISLPASKYTEITGRFNYSAQKYITQYMPATLTLLETEANQPAIELLRRVGPSLQHLKLICAGQDIHPVLGMGALALSINLQTVTLEQQLLGEIGDEVIPVLSSINSALLHTVVITGVGELSILRSNERKLELLAATFMDPGLVVGDSKVKLTILYTDIDPTADSKRNIIQDRYYREFHLLDRLGRLEVKRLTGEMRNNYSPFEIFRSNISLV